jgi:ABC-type Fe3+-hydroxamate transport system substrate-binding protein
MGRGQPIRTRDTLGREVELAGPPARIVSLVPSVTETLFAIGAGERLVGVTEYCVHPADAVKHRAKVGGTKNVRVDDVLALAPDLVIANREENRRRTVDALAAAGVPVFVTYARGVLEAAGEIERLGELLGCAAPAARIATATRAALAVAAGRSGCARTPVAALVWKDPYMAVGPDTFAHDLLESSGGRNVFAAATGRYPRIDPADLERAAPELILLPTEPYAFGEEDRLALLRLACPASRSGRVYVIEGELLSWYGPRMPRALDTLSRLLVP